MITGGDVRGGRVGVVAVAALCLFGAAPLPAASQATTGVTVSGLITGGATADTVPLPHAVIELLTEVRRATTADAQGHYQLTGVRSGEARIRVVHSGHEPLEVTVVVPATGTLRLDLHLKGAPVDLGEIEVAGTQGISAGTPEGRPADANPAATRELEAEALMSTSGIVEVGLAEAARRNSGNEPPDPTTLLFMRGSTADLKLVLLDGAPIHTPFHLGGLLEPIQPRTIGRTRLFLGGAPARYNGGLSHILDIETRRPDAGPATGQVSADLMGLSAVGEKGLGPVGFLASGRILHGLASSLFADGHQPYGYRDGLIRGDVDVGEGHFSVTAFTNRESVNLDPLFGLEAQGTALDGPSELRSLASTDAEWSNAIVSARYQVPLGDWSLRATAAGSRYDAQLPVGDSTLTILGGASSRTHLTVDLERPTSWGTASAGLSYEATAVRERADQISGPALHLSTRTMEGRVAGAYVEASRNLGGVTLRGGLRGDGFRGGGHLYLSPRVSLLWPMSETALFRLAVGRYSQLARRSDPAVTSDLGIQSQDLGDEPLLGIATATHLVASVDQRLTPALTVGLEGFVKSFDGLPETDGERLNTSGMDLRIARDQGDARGWLGYTLSWYWSGGSLSRARFSGHHLLTAGLSGPFTRFLTGTARLSYGSGLPFSSVPFGDEVADPTGLGSEEAQGDGLRNDSDDLPTPEESFLRLDLTVSGRWTMGDPGRRWTLQPYLRVLNALDRRDALFYYFEPWRSETPEPLTDLPVLPILGLTVAF